MKKPHKAVTTALLPQYQGSELIKELMLEAIHCEDSEIERVDNNPRLIEVTKKELDSDALFYFYENREAFRDEFIDELEQCGISSEEYISFCNVIAKEWITGRPLDGVLKLKKSILNYFQEINQGRTNFEKIIRSSVDELSLIEPLISTKTLLKILSINHQMLYEHIEKWKDSHPDRDKMSSGSVFLRRGLHFNTNLDTLNPYIEKDFINSYTIALTVAERFSQENNPEFRVHIHGDLRLFENRVLFFSPFIPNMEVGELEFGIIPSEKPLPLHPQDLHGGIHEYLLDPMPFQIRK